MKKEQAGEIISRLPAGLSRKRARSPLPNRCLLDLEGVRGQPVVAAVVVVICQGVEAAHALDLEDRAGPGVVCVGISRGGDGVALAERARDVQAGEGQTRSEGRLATRVENHDGVGDAPERTAAVGIGRATGRHDVDVNTDVLRVIALVADLDDDVLGIGLAVAKDDAARC